MTESADTVGTHAVCTTFGYTVRTNTVGTTFSYTVRTNTVGTTFSYTVRTNTVGTTFSYHRGFRFLSGNRWQSKSTGGQSGDNETGEDLLFHGRSP